VAGARSGKDSRIAAPAILYEALWGGHAERLHKGERGVLALVASDRDQTKVAFTYCRDYLLESPYLRTMVAGEPLRDEIVLTNGLRIVTFPCSQKSLRAWSIPVGVLDELAFFRFEGGMNSDVEVQASIRRGMIAFGDRTLLLKISTPYMRDGVLYDDFQRAWGKDDPDSLVWRASTESMNPSIKAERLAREKRLDPSRYAREYLAEWTDDLETFLPTPLVEAAVMRGRTGIPPTPRMAAIAAVDPSGGGSDAFTSTICIPELDPETGRITVVQVHLNGWRRERDRHIDLEAVVQEMAGVMLQYGCSQVIGDRYSAQWVRQAFQRHGIVYVEAPEKAQAYLGIEPLFSSGRIKILDHPQQTRELTLLEKRPRIGGKPLIDHPKGGNDDFANVLALAANAVIEQHTMPLVDPTPQPDEIRQLHELFPGFENIVFEDDYRL
jgi:hypothetical protein